MATTENDLELRSAARWRFGEAELDENTLELRLAGALIEVERKPLELLMLLLRHPGEVLTKDELIESLWADRVVSESVLTKCVAKLRQALGDQEQSQIKTVHGYGYRFMVPVVCLPAPARAEPPPSGLKEGDQPPLRPNWNLVRRFGGARGENWLAEHQKTRERRVFKLATDAEGLSQIKREITLHRLIRETLGQREDLVRVLDWNLEEAPYFLEVDYCSQGSLADYLEAAQGDAAVNLETRLELMAQTADALAACHLVGVLHKDLKPANVFVELDPQGVAKIRIGDFGSGRVFEPDRLRALEITRMGFTQSLLADATTSGTFAYLAPEVVAGQPPTVQSDIYSLGVMLYQLVIGDLRRPLAPGWEREVDDELLREDIAAASDTDPSRRLVDAADLARRLRTRSARRLERAAQRAQADQAEQLRRALERTRARRGWLLATTFVSIAAAGVIGALYLKMMSARDQAQENAAATAAVNEFLVNDLIAAADPLRTGARDRTVRAALQASEASIGTRFAAQPLQEAAIQRALGNAWYGVSEFDAARRALERSLLLAEQVPGDPDLRVQTAIELVVVLDSLDDLEAQRRVLTEAAAVASDSRVTERSRLLLRMSEAALLNRQGDYAGAVAAFTPLLEPARELLGERHEQYAEMVSLAAEARMNVAFDDEALALAREAMGLKRAVHGEQHPRAVEAMRQFAATLRNNERFDEAEALLAEAMAVAESALGPEHDVTLRVATEQALVDLDRGRLPESVRRFEAALEIRERLFGAAHSDTRTTLGNLAFALGEQGRHGESLALFRRAHSANVAALGARHPDTLVSHQNIARTLMDMEQWREAAVVQQELLGIATEVIPEHWHHAVMLMSAGQTQVRLGERQRAREYMTRAVQILSAARGAEHPRTVQARTALAALDARAD